VLPGYNSESNASYLAPAPRTGRTGHALVMLLCCSVCCAGCLMQQQQPCTVY